jgi:opacity protein-like surface antigen
MKITSLITAFALITVGTSYAGPLGPAPVNPIVNYGPAPVDGGWYFGLNGGFLWMNDVHLNNLDFSFDTGWGAIGVVGYQFANGLGLGISSGYMRGEFANVSGYGRELGVDADLHMVPITLSASYTIKLTDVLHLYVGGGIGTAWTELNADAIQGVGVNARTDGWNLAYQGRAGFGVKLADGVSMNLGYRFMSVIDGVADYADANSHMAEAGLKVNF